MQRKRLYTILSAIVFIGLLSVLGAFFVDHQVADSCVFNLSTNCPLYMGASGEAAHLLQTFGQYLGGIASLPLVLLTLIICAVVFLAQVTGLTKRCFLIYKEIENNYSPALSSLLFAIGLHNKRSPRLVLITRDA